MLTPVVGWAAEEKEGADQLLYSPGEKDFREKTMKLKALETDIAEADQAFASLVGKKNKAQSKSKALEIIEQMKEVKTQRDKDAEKFNEIREELIYKFPDKGRTVMRKYAPMQQKTLEQMEKKSSLDKDLTRARKKAQKIYRPFIREAKEKEELEEKKKSQRLLRIQAEAVKTKEAPGKPKQLKLQK